jgi:hypothetical protein
MLQQAALVVVTAVILLYYGTHRLLDLSRSLKWLPNLTLLRNIGFCILAITNGLIWDIRLKLNHP